MALRAVAELPVRVLLTVGNDLDLDALPSVPDNVRVERWVPQQDVLGHAAMAVVHGGSGSTLGAIAAGVPLVVVPLFADQPENARRVAEVGAGLSVEPDREDSGRDRGARCAAPSKRCSAIPPTASAHGRSRTSCARSRPWTMPYPC